MERLKIDFSEKSTTPATPTTCWPIQRTAADGPPIGPFATDCGARRWGSETIAAQDGGAQKRQNPLQYQHQAKRRQQFIPHSGLQQPAPKSGPLDGLRQSSLRLVEITEKLRIWLQNQHVILVAKTLSVGHQASMEAIKI